MVRSGFRRLGMSRERRETFDLPKILSETEPRRSELNGNVIREGVR